MILPCSTGQQEDSLESSRDSQQAQHTAAVEAVEEAVGSLAVAVAAAEGVRLHPWGTQLGLLWVLYRRLGADWTKNGQAYQAEGHGAGLVAAGSWEDMPGRMVAVAGAFGEAAAGAAVERDEAGEGVVPQGALLGAEWGVHCWHCECSHCQGTWSDHRVLFSL